MARREVVTYECDRCRKPIDLPAEPDPTSSLPVVLYVAQLHVGTPEPVGDVDLCLPCSEAFSAFMAGAWITQAPPKERLDVHYDDPPPGPGTVGQALLDAQNRIARRV